MNERYLQEIVFHWDRLEEDSYVREIPALASLKALPLTANITLLSGENGTGKSTLLEAVAVAYGFNPEGGSINYRFSTRATHSDLHRALTLVKGPRRPKNSYFLRAESFYNVATQAEEYAKIGPPGYFEAYGGRSFHDQSHGEGFLALMQNTFTPKGLYILDEPESALSPQRQLTLLIQMYHLANCGAQFLMATHSPILLGIPGASILAFDEERVHPCAYEETESYQVTELFLNNREALLKRLLSDP